MKGSGGFHLPRLYKWEQQKVLGAFSLGSIDHADLSQWSFGDEFLCFAIQTKFFEFADKSFPNPREKNEVPIWFLISCQLILRLLGDGRYDHLHKLMNSGAVLSRVGYNIGSTSIGFNQKNKNHRKTAVHPDTVRKYFKDTKPSELREWYNEDVQRWFRGQRAFDTKGLFILDQTHLVVPDNPNYKDAVKMPVDAFGQRYPNYNVLTLEAKHALTHHPCYTMSCLLHIGLGDSFHIAGYELGPGNEDELPQAKKLLPTFCKSHPGLMQELIVDRGYVDGDFVGSLKTDLDVDVLVPLKKNMDSYIDSVEIATRENKWEILEEEKKSESGQMIKRQQAVLIEEIDLWESCSVKQFATVVKQTEWDDEESKYHEHIWVLGSTKKYSSPGAVIARYGLRTQIEERYRQFKHGGWMVGKFPSPHESLIESHVCFSMLTYSLLQLYLRREDLKDQNRRFMETLKHEEQLGKNAVLIYAKDSFAILDLDDCMIRTLDLTGEAKEKVKNVLERQKEARLRRTTF